MRLVGQFRDRADPSRFTWLRAFPSMEMRGKALGDFYFGPVWQAHRAAANAMTLFEKTPEGDRLSTRYPDGYFRLIRDFAAHGRVTGNYGDAQISGGATDHPDPRRP